LISKQAAEHEFMATKNYYAILGVSQDETQPGIRAAYREAVRRTHPDYAGADSSLAFQAIAEAHSVLTDPNRRREYNEILTLEKCDPNQSSLLRDVAARSEPRSLFADPHAVHPSFQALAERVRRNFTGRGVTKAERPESLSIEVILTPEEAMEGGLLSVGIPVHQLCTFCYGTGHLWPFLCRNCSGAGVVSRMQPVEVRIPQSLSPGFATDISLQRIGVSNLFLKLHFRVSSEQLYA
jgi:molecular chaperone DnaJ